ncbi:GntR family transcriptional regulator [Acetobacteraceae bacterium ESL0709]|nr:GntR family transcriptional regulator [Acetobacteraceae bacterium ESL0697]MDF7679080.1 GntR family transcriptional regulator [Acetobacteraceae bacterium ESL0709]
MKKSNSSTYNDRAYTVIKEMAMKFIFPPEKKINIMDLSETIHVSQTPVREALNRLFNEKLVVRSTSARGFFGRSVNYQEYVELIFMRKALIKTYLYYLLKDSYETCEEFISKRRILNSVDRISKETFCPFYYDIIEATGNNEILELNYHIMDRIFYLWRFISENYSEANKYIDLQDELMEAMLKKDILESEIKIGIIARYEVELFHKLLNSMDEWLLKQLKPIHHIQHYTSRIRSY